jgi:EpsD family peptidyl-prolyl cis-trans isomerase
MPVRRLAMITFALLLAACSKSHTADSAATQVAAKVNGGEITVYRLNSAVAQVPNVTAQSATAVSENVLERLIDQELLVQKAQEAKLDRNPRVVQAIEEAKRSVLASAYLQQIVGEVPKPSDQEIHDYYVHHPEYFSARRSYVYRSIEAHVTPAEVHGIQQEISSTKDIDAVLSYLRASRLSFVTNTQAKTTEQLPVEVVRRFTTLKEGDTATFASAGGVELVQLISSKVEPVDEAQGQPFIEKYLLDQHRNERAANEVKSLRAAATIQYLGNFHAPPVATSTSMSSRDDSASGLATGLK